ncbi:phosphate ABC transporter permease PstA [Intestinimonas sp. MSJ-38]|uniref:phosphate ABC transporter permease PstA n=1 Tax=Intestinimonas sp. MSJ-38 TaxID=2841532 RepID=UPI000E4E5856|nr:phosphate ABC transporter permease PstA [Intestinimonas sp. MSJ-38]MBU5433712.1 phosphate ABC transporter permease PstA [Intestinimonas sp. MSJ-38]RHT71118.1 phosphate ABC transporter permease PtsA [Ruminococcaceae bacterium AM28-23LB]
MNGNTQKKSLRADPFSLVMRVLVWGAALLTAGVLLALIAYILIRGVPNLKLSLFELEYNSENVSMFPSIVMTIYMTVLTLIITTPLGIGCAIYLTEYAKRGNKVVEVIRLAAETLSGIPSIVYGLFGMLFFVTALQWKNSILAGSCTLAIMVLPLIIRSTEEALKSVPDSYREASFGLGAGKLRTVVRVVLPPAMPGIVAGVILAVGRIVGETAALIYTAGTVAKITINPMESARTLAVHMYALSSEGLHTNEAFATGVVLLLVVLMLNATSNAIAKRITKGK